MGFLVAERLASRWGGSPWRRTCDSLVSEAGVGGDRVLLGLPQTYMNRSGIAVRLLLEHTGAELSRLLVIHDDLDLPFGKLRIRAGGGHGGHQGMRSILDALGTGEFPRVKIGIGRPAPGEDAVDHVLSPFDPEERDQLPIVLDRAADASESIVSEGVLPAMNRFNA